MEHVCGNIFIRNPEVRMSKGSVVVGHTHNFDHATFCASGALLIELLPLLKDGESDDGVPAESQVILRADAMQTWALIRAGRRHRITALEDRSSYMCIYAHRMPQALALDIPGNIERPPYMRRDDDGTLWVRVDESIVQETNNWAPAYV